MINSNILKMAALAGLVASQSLSSLNLTQQCQTTLNAAIGNQELSKCLNLNGVLPILGITGNSSVIPPVDNYLKGLCAADPCSNSTLTTLASNITSGCATDLQNHNIDPQTVTSILDQVISFFPTVRKIACLKESNNTLCVTQELDDIQSATNQTLTPSSILNIPNMITSPSLIPKDLICNDCIQAAWSILKTDVPIISQDPSISSFLTQECGSSLVNATSLPSDISEGTGSAAPPASTSGSGSGSSPSSSSTGAASSSLVVTFGNGLSGLVVTGLVALLAGGAMLF